MLAAVASSATAILAKIGVQGVPSNVAVAVRTTVVLVFAWALALVTDGSAALRAIAPRPLAFLVASGLATGVAWWAYFRALALAPASRVAPVDKLSVALTVALAALVLGESVPLRVALGAALIVVGTLLTIA